MDFKKYSKFITKNRYNRLLNVLNKRTRYFSFVFENFYDSHNVSAGLRSIEGFGFQDVHVVEGDNKFKTSKGITQGSDKWINIYKYKKYEDCLNKLHKKNYKVLIAEPDDKYPPLNEMKLDSKTAFLFGQEGYGVSELAKEKNDGCFYIPINGFVESFNVSVSVAVTAYHLRSYLENNISKDKWLLSESEKEDILENWFKKENTIRKILEKEGKL